MLPFQDDDYKFAKELCHTLYYSTGVPALFLPAKASTFLPSEPFPEKEPYQGYVKNQMALLAEKESKNNSMKKPGLSLLAFHELLLYYVLNQKGSYEGTFLIGPMRFNEQTSTKELEQLNLMNPNTNVTVIKGYLESIPFISASQISALEYLFEIVVKTDIKNDIPIFPYSIENKKTCLSPVKIKDIVKHHPYMMEEKMINEVFLTDKPIEEIFRENTSEIFLPPLAKNDILRSEKNRMIIASSVLCRAAIKFGVPAEVAFTYHDLFIIRLEEITDIDTIFLVSMELFNHLRKETCKAKSKSGYSTLTRHITDYIVDHIDRKLDLKTLCTEMKLNYKYASRCFHKDTGMSFSEYVYKNKIETAKRLLRNDQLRIEDIAQYLDFNEPYYFAKVFKQYEGISPSEYRNCPY